MSACSLCGGRGYLIGGDSEQSCPKCRGRVECGRCSRMVNAVDADELVGSAGKWHRCHDCRDRDARNYAEAVSA